MKIMMIEISGTNRDKSANTLIPPLSTGQCEPPAVTNLEANSFWRGSQPHNEPKS